MNLTPEAALDIIKPFFPNEWARTSVSNVRLHPIKSGAANSVTVISRQPSSSSDLKEPLKLLIRMKGGSMVDNDQLPFNTDASSTLIAYEMDRLGIGPKIYGVFNGGTIQEFVESHTLTPKEASDPIISRDIALAIARVHAIQGLPLKLTVHEEGDLLQRQWVKEIEGKIMSLSAHKAFKMYGVDPDLVTSFDFKGNTEWMVSVFERLKNRMRVNFILNDMNYDNCLVLSSEESENLGVNKCLDDSETGDAEGEIKSKVTLIDFDLAHYDYRGKDLGIHFFNRIMNYGGVSYRVHPNIEIPNREQRIKFLKIYQQEIKRLQLWENFDEDGVDSIDNLLLESLIGMTHYTLFWTTFATVNFEAFLDHDPMGILGKKAFIENFIQFKKEVENELLAQNL